MIAEESAKWAEAFARCASKRELNDILKRIGESQRISVRPGEEHYEDIARKLGFELHAELGHRFQAAVARVRRHRHG